jgi:hypothetical protein
MGGLDESDDDPRHAGIAAAQAEKESQRHDVVEKATVEKPAVEKEASPRAAAAAGREMPYNSLTLHVR